MMFASSPSFSCKPEFFSSFSPEETTPYTSSSTTSSDSFWNSAGDSASIGSIKLEPLSDEEDELFAPNIVLGQPYASPYLYPTTVEVKQEIPAQYQFFSSQPTESPSTNPTDMNRVVKCQTFSTNGLTCGDCASNSSPHVVATGQIEASNLERREKDAEINPEESSKRKPIPVDLSASVLGDFHFPPNIELPAILGGKLPPRISKTSHKKHVYTERELRRRRKRGLTEDSDSESEERRKVRLPHRSLLTITTAQMSQFVNFLRTHTDLTPSQKDELSRQKRLVKNRESACRFRAKNFLSLVEYRERVAELENDVTSLRQENEKLRKALSEASGSIALPHPDLPTS